MIRKNVEAYTTVLFSSGLKEQSLNYKKHILVSNANEKGAKNKMPSRNLLQKNVASKILYRIIKYQATRTNFVSRKLVMDK
jgi:hypothetical protein